MHKQEDLKKGEVLVQPYKEGDNLSFQVLTNHHRLIADEPKDLGGDDLGLNPFDFLATSLATCTAMTLRFYAKHKGIELGDFQVKVSQKHVVDASTGLKTYVLTRELIFADEIDETRLSKYKEIADKCPVHKTLSGKIEIVTV